MPGQMFTEQLSKTVERYIWEFVLVQPTLWNFFNENGLVRNIGEGIDKLTYFDWKKPDASQMSSSIHDANVISPRFGETTVGLLYLACKIQISKQDVDKFKNNQFTGGNLIRETIQRTIPVMVNQVDQFLAWGDEMRSPVKAFDPFRGSGEFTGIFNGGSVTAGGIDDDNDMQIAGDYLATVVNMRNAFKSAGHDMPKYPIFSDLQTDKYSELENQFYSTVGISERQRVLEKKYIADWHSSYNFLDYTAAKYRMAMIAPKQRVGRGARAIVPTIELVQGYPFTIHMEHNGGTNNGYYEWLLIWSGRLIERYATAIQRTGTLTLT